MGRILNLRDFPGTDARRRFADALEAARRTPGTTLIVPPGVYPISSDQARQTQADVLSGVYGENPEKDLFSPEFPYTVGLDLRGHTGTTVEAYGALLLADGFMEPVAVRECRGVTVCGLTVDTRRKPYSRGTITGWRAEDRGGRTGQMEVCFDGRFPVDGRTIMPRWCIYDFHTHRFNLDLKIRSRSWLGGQNYRFEAEGMQAPGPEGAEFYVWHSFHSRPAVMIESSWDITLRDVTIHSHPGMGVLGHRSGNILLERLRVVPSHGEHMSTNTDATHFTSCRGTLDFIDCEFSGHGDDATNVHTFYHDIAPLGGDAYRGSVSVTTHSLTADHPDPGDELELVDRRTLERRGVYHVLECTPETDARGYTARVDAPLPPDAGKTSFFCNVSQLPRLRFIGCTADNHWARSVLIKTRHALVEGCTFTGSALQAVHVAAEGWWREGAACEDVVIRGNRFTDCGRAGHGKTGGIRVEMAADAPRGTPQRGIVIEDNLFDLSGVENAVHVSNAEDVVIRDNVFLNESRSVEIRDCVRVQSDIPAIG